MKYKLVFENVDCETGYEFGICLHDYLRDKGVTKFCISITLFGKEVFRYMSNDCIIDNGSWLKRKTNACIYFGMSTLELFDKNKGQESNLSQKYGLDNSLYTFTAGSIPVVLSNNQIIGAVTVSGMLPQEDHESILEAYKLFTKRK